MNRPSISQISIFIISMLIAFVAKSFFSSSEVLIWEHRSLSHLPQIFGTKTTYQDSFKISFEKTSFQGEKVVLSKPIIQINKETTCHPIKVIGVYRHGTRYPTTKHINFANEIVEKLKRFNIDNNKLNSLKSVLDLHIRPEFAGQLVKLGEREHERLGFRTRKRFRSLFDDQKNFVKYMTTSVKRAENSMHAFYRTFNETETPLTDFEVRDDLLRFHENCPEYRVQVKKNKTALVEYYKFLNKISSKVNEVIARNLKLTQPIDLSEDEIMSWVNIAAAETAIVRTDNWLKYLDVETLQLLEYAVDLEQYYLTGYGYMLNYEMSCPLFSHIFHEMDKALSQNTNNDKRNAGLFYFAHAETLSPLLALFGFYKDKDTLTAENYLMMKHRLFRTTIISPFANNLQLVMYNCTNQDNQYMIQFLHKEQPILIDGLRSESRYGLYPYSQVREKYKSIINNCNFDAMCAVN